ncbi:hypothetical protein GGX14DRAFT_399391 [Mycena pura]|uniref:Uncharacterized protein n=1 Tax=Mycena pura TaxID=153505 RepID=A0AAD6V504_9AGAR|nr:hypothetical protein GGX14DRAFT_399391 [Mycena pura]
MFSHLKTMLLPPAPSQSALRASNQDVVTRQEAPPPPCLTPWRIVASFNPGARLRGFRVYWLDEGPQWTTMKGYGYANLLAAFGERNTSQVELNRAGGGASATPFGGAQLLVGIRRAEHLEGGINRAGGGASATPFGGAQLLVGIRRAEHLEGGINRAGGGASATPFGGAQLLAFGERNTSKVELNRAGGGASATPFGGAQLPVDQHLGTSWLGYPDAVV